jgi:hypothetical protein
MTEIKRPASVRELVDQLSRAALVNLCEGRGLHVSRANDACRSSISRSFRGQREVFLASLRKDDLEQLLSLPIRDGEELLGLPNCHGYTKRQLCELAILAYGPTRGLAAPFVALTDDEDDDGETEDDESEDGGDDPDEDDGGESDLRLEPESAPTLAAAAGAGWSRLRPIRPLFSQLGLAEPVGELTQDAFGALLDALELRGYEVATADGTRLTPLHDAIAIDAELRLRHDAFAAAPTTLRNGMAGGGAPPQGREAFELGEYERASLRLQLLTASHAAEGLAPEQLAKSVELATTGLAIHGVEQALLERVATALARTRRDPVTVLTGLVRRLDAEDGEVLLREYAELHPGDEELQALLADHWAALCKAPGGAIQSP